MKKLIFLSLLTACGTSEMSDSQKEEALLRSETSESLPDFSGWQVMPNANDTCLRVDASEMSCSSEFESEKNCTDASFAFIVKKDGYMYVMILEDVVIRQGEPHKIEFEGRPEHFNIQNNFSGEMYHAFQCRGANGQVVKL